MQMYPAYNQSHYEEDYSAKKDEFHIATKGCATPPMQGFEQNFDKVSHGYAGGQVHNFDKPMHGLSKDEFHNFDKPMHGLSKDEFHYDNHSSSMNMMKASGSPTSPLHGFHAGSQAHGMHSSNKDEFHYDRSSSMNMMKGGRSPTPPMHSFQQNFDKVGHGHAGGQAHSYDSSMHGFTGHNQNLDKFTHGGGYGGYEQNFDKATHGYAGGYDKFNQGGGYNSQYQSSNFEKEGHHSSWNGGNDHYAHGGNGYNAHGGSGHYAQGGNMGNHQGYGNKYTAGMSQAQNFEMSAGYGGHQGPTMPMGGNRPHAGQKKGVFATWNFKGIRD